MRKFIVTAALSLTLAGLGAPAFAGEVTGGPNPKPTPIDSYTANSICAFSGQNDDPTGHGDPIEAGRVQSWGQTRNNLIAAFDPNGNGASGLNPLLRSFGPGVSCRGGLTEP